MSFAASQPHLQLNTLNSWCLQGGGQTVDGVMGRRVEEGAYTASLGQGVATVSGKCPLA